MLDVQGLYIERVFYSKKITHVLLVLWYENQFCKYSVSVNIGI